MTCIFELRLREGVVDGKNMLHTEIWVDGKRLDAPHFIDLPLLVQSMYEQRWFDIFTCGCGAAACAGIADGIKVTHDKGLLRWSFRQPLAAANLWDELVLESWAKTAAPITFTFERNQLLMAVEAYIDAARELVRKNQRDYEWPVHGLSIEDVLKIDPSRPIYEIESLN